MFYLVKTYEEVSSYESMAVQLRIHKGSLEAIENHWSAWNGEFKKHRRYDKVIYSSDNIEPIIEALRREYASIFRGEEVPRIARRKEAAHVG